MFSDARFNLLVSKVNDLRTELDNQMVSMKSELSKLNTQTTGIKNKIELVDRNVNAVCEDLKHLQEALKRKQQREAVVAGLKV